MAKDNKEKFDFDESDFEALASISSDMMPTADDKPAQKDQPQKAADKNKSAKNEMSSKPNDFAAMQQSNIDEMFEADHNDAPAKFKNNVPVTNVENINYSSDNDENKEGKISNDRNLESLYALPVDVSVVLGKTDLIISDLLLMGQGSVIELDKLIGDDLDIFVNGKPIAKGAAVLSNNNFGCKISRILTPIERLRKLVMEK